MPNGIPIATDLQVLEGFAEPFRGDEGVPRDERMALRWGCSVKQVYVIWDKKRFSSLYEWGVSQRSGWLTEEGRKRLAELRILIMKHELYETRDKDAPDAIRDRNGEVCLALCRVCGGAEATLPPECPGRKLTESEELNISSGKMDFALGGSRLIFCSGSLDAVPRATKGRRFKIIGP